MRNLPIRRSHSVHVGNLRLFTQLVRIKKEIRPGAKIAPQPSSGGAYSAAAKAGRLPIGSIRKIFEVARQIMTWICTQPNAER